MEDRVGAWGGKTFLAMEDGEDSVAGPSQCMYLTESSAEMSAEHSQQLATLRKKRKKSALIVEAKRAAMRQCVYAHCACG